VALTALVAVVGLVASVSVGAVVASGQRNAAKHQLDRRATLVAEAVASETGRYVDTVRTVAAATGAFDTLTAAQFAQANAPLAQMHLAGATSIVFLVPAADQEVASTQALWRSRGLPDLTLTAQGDPRQHIFSIFVESLDGISQRRPGVDITQAPAPTQALTEAWRTGHVTISDAYHLIIDQNLPSKQQQMSFSLTAPVYGPPDAQGKRTFRGWVLMGLRGQDFTGATLARVSQNQLDVTIRARNSAGADVPVATHTAAVSGSRDLSRHVDVTVANQRWQLDIQAIGGRLPGGTTSLPNVVTGAGIVLSMLLAGLVWMLATGRSRARAQVHVATADARRQAGLLSAILDSISDGVGVVDAQGEFLLHNPAAKAMLGINDDRDGAPQWQEHYGIYLPDGHTPFPTAEMPLVRALAGESTEQVEMVIRNAGQPDGVVITVSGRPLHPGAGQAGAVAVFHDVTARKAAEIELRAARDELAEQRAYLHEVLDAIDVTVVTCDTTGAIVHSNRVARQIRPPGGGPETIIEAIRDANVRTREGAPLATEEVPAIRALAGEQVNNLEAVVPLPDGSHKSIMVHARPLHDTAGHIIGAVTSSYDITALREREADLHAFASIAAHDLKAPLAAVAGFAEILDDELVDGADPVSLRPLLARIAGGVDRMRRLIDDLLVYATARDGQLQLQSVDLHTLVGDVVAERTAHLRGGSGGQPALFPDIYTGPLPLVLADKAMTRQLLDNVIGNALKYTVPGQPARIDISAEPGADGWTRVLIADRGIGIPAADQPHVFTSFHRAAAHTTYSGTGLGLAICHRVIDRHGGTITAGDNPGGGTRITFTLPTTATTHASAPATTPSVPTAH
jgi:signal transduction histidine kinase/CHASE1-domain containing sensor protein